MQLFRLLKGYIQVSTDCMTPERFFNLCRTHKIAAWGIACRDKEYFFYMDAGDFLRLKAIIRKCNIKLRIRRKIGLPFFAFRYRRHYSFLIGIFLSAVILHILSLFVWNIDIEGNRYYTDNVMISYLSEQGITVGEQMKNISCSELEQLIRRDFEDITWVSVEQSGTRLIVHVKENDGDKIETVVKNPSDIIASADGVIETIITRCGTPLVKPQDSVKTGDVLVSGEIILYNDAKEAISNRYVYSDADIMLRTTLTYEDTIQRNFRYKIYTGRKNTNSIIYIMGRQIELGIDWRSFDNFDSVTQTRDMKLNYDFYLPVSIGQKADFEYYTEDGFYGDEEISQLLTDNYNNYLKKLQKKGIQIIGDSVKIDLSNVNGMMSGNIQVVMPMEERRASEIKTIEPPVPQS